MWLELGSPGKGNALSALLSQLKRQSVHCRQGRCYQITETVSHPQDIPFQSSLCLTKEWEDRGMGGAYGREETSRLLLQTWLSGKGLTWKELRELPSNPLLDCTSYRDNKLAAAPP